MVFFSCDGCGDMLKKSQVDAHVHRCRDGCPSVSCVDCNVSFYGDDYRAHTSCLTESERYEKGDAKGAFKSKKNKKVSPQEAWMDLITESIDDNSTPSHLKKYLQTMSTLSNVPRKEKQFRNFTSNSLNLNRSQQHATIVGEIWTLLKTRQDEQRKQREQEKEQQQQQQQQNNINDNNNKPQPPAKKDSSDDESGSDSDEGDATRINKASAANNTNGGELASPEPAAAMPAVPQPQQMTRKAVKKAMKKALKKAPSNQLSFKSLRKAVRTQLGLKKSKLSSDKKQLKQMLKGIIGNDDNDDNDSGEKKKSKKKKVMMVKEGIVRLKM